MRRLIRCDSNASPTITSRRSTSIVPSTAANLFASTLPYFNCLRGTNGPRAFQWGTIFRCRWFLDSSNTAAHFSILWAVDLPPEKLMIVLRGTRPTSTKINVYLIVKATIGAMTRTSGLMKLLLGIRRILPTGETINILWITLLAGFSTLSAHNSVSNYSLQQILITANGNKQLHQCI